jgi:DNA-binding transcriptional regulator YdaS (Cro superfamily)
MAVEGELQNARPGEMTASKSTVVGENVRPAQSFAVNSPSSISQSGLIRSRLPAKDDRD